MMEVRSDARAFAHPNAVIPRQLRAVLRIATSSPELLLKFCPYISLERREIAWDHVFAQDLSDGNTSAIHWAYAIWTGDTSTRNISIYSMDGRLTCAVLEALGIAWGVLGSEEY